MATKFQIKRTSVAGRTPNTSNQANSSYIAAGELAVNLTDKKLYSSNGTYHFEIGAFDVQLVNSTSNVSTYTQISTLQFDEDSGFDVTNPSAGIAKVAMNSTFKYWQVDGVTKLTATGLDTVNFIGGNNVLITANGANTPQSIAFATSMTPTFTSVTFGNSTVNTTINSSAIAVTKIFANGFVGTAGKVLTSNGTGGIYWSDPTSGGGGGGDLTIISDTFNGNGSNTQFTLSVTTQTNKTFVYLNGVLQAPTTDYSVANNILTFATAPPSDNAIEVRTFDIPSVADLTVTSDNFTGNGSNTQFTLTTSLSSDQTSLVFLNGVAQVPTTDYTISGSTLTFTAAPANGTNIQVTSYTAEDIATTTYTGNGSNTQFTLGTTSTTSKTVVSLNGVTQTPVADYSVSGAILVFSVAPANGDKIIARSIPSTASSTAGSNTNVQYNKSGSLGGSAGFVFDETTNNVTIANTLTVPNLRISASNPPANSTATGTTGTIAWDSSYLYVATGTNTWKKTPITTDGAGGGGSANTAGANTEIQFNDSNALGANSKFTFNKDTTTLAIGSNVTVNTSTIFIGNSTVNTTITAGNVHLQGTQLTVGNVVITGSQITVGNSTVNTVIGANSFGVGMLRDSFTGNGSNTQYTLSSTPTDESHTLVFVDRVIQRDADYNISGTTLTFTAAPDNGSEIDVYIARAGIATLSGNGSSITSVNAATVGGNTASTLRSYSDTVAATAFSNAAARADSAYSNAVSYADTKAATAYSNATSYADTKAATAYSNATSYADTKAATAFSNAASRADSAYSNAVSYADTKAATAYSNATSYADTKASAAYSNAIAYSGNAAAAYTNAVAYANSTFLPLAGGTLNGTLTFGNSTVNTVINSTSVVVTKVVANSSAGSDGQILTSNGAGVYWANAASTSKYSNQYLLTGTTTNATETEIFIDGGATRIPVAVNKTVYYTIDCVCRRTDSTGDHGAFFLKGVATNASGTTTDVGSIYEVIVTRSDANFAIDARANNASDSVNIFVTGATGKTVSWSCVVTTMEV
jgi:hypothetical protein